MPISMLEYVVRSLSPLTARDIEALALETRISKWTIQKIRLRQIENPGVKSIEPLYHNLKLREIRRKRVA